MAKKPTDTMKASDLAEFLEKHDDFDLELEIYRHAIELGFEATHGGTYKDPVTHKPRQYDIRASKAFNNGNRVDLAIECKALQTSFPLLIPRVNRSQAESFHQVFKSRTKDPAFGDRIPEPQMVPPLVPTLRRLYRSGDPVGKSTKQVGRTNDGEFRSGDGESYDKWSQALASAWDLITESMRPCR